MTTMLYIGTHQPRRTEHPMTAAYKRPHTTRATSNYTLTLTVPDAAAAQVVMYRVLNDAGITRTATIRDAAHAGVSWRASSDTQAEATAALLRYAVAQQQTILTSRLHTGYGIHTRELVTAG